MSLVGVLVMVLVLGALGAAAVLGVSQMTGSKDDEDTRTRTAIDAAGVRACQASADAARAASTVYFANGGGTYPTTWSDLTGSASPVFSLPSNAVINRANPKELDSTDGWKLIISNGGAHPAQFTCSSS
jgi:hypothetical protein